VKSSSSRMLSRSIGSDAARAETESAFIAGASLVGFFTILVPPWEQWTSTVTVSLCTPEGLLGVGIG
jgi:hypothetical protein